MDVLVKGVARITRIKLINNGSRNLGRLEETHLIL